MALKCKVRSPKTAQMPNRSAAARTKPRWDRLRAAGMAAFGSARGTSVCAKLPR